MISVLLSHELFNKKANINWPEFALFNSFFFIIEGDMQYAIKIFPGPSSINFAPICKQNMSHLNMA